MVLAATVTVGVLDAALSDDGELRAGVLVDVVVRAALLVDLALDGRVPQSMEIDTSPTGYAPADRLLQAIDADPERSLAWWLSHGPVTARDVAEHLVRTGDWTQIARTMRHPHRRYAVGARPSGPGARVRPVMNADDPYAPFAAAHCLSAGAGLADPGSDPAGVLAQSGPVRWLVEELVCCVEAKRATIAAGTSITQSQLIAGVGGW